MLQQRDANIVYALGVVVFGMTVSQTHTLCTYYLSKSVQCSDKCPKGMSYKIPSVYSLRLLTNINHRTTAIVRCNILK